MSTSRQIETTDGVTLALHHLGGDGPPLMICHATGFHGRAYRAIARTLAEQFSVWAIDFRGQGSSTVAPSGDFAWSKMADDLLDCIDDLGFETVHALGHSMGGSAVLLAEQKRPGTITAAYLYEPIVFPEDRVATSAESPLAEPARRRRPVFESRQAAYDRYASRPPLSFLEPESLSDYVEFGFVDTDDGQVRLACEPESEAQIFMAEGMVSVTRLEGLQLRAMVGAGAAPPSGPNPAAFAPFIVDAIDGAVLANYDDLGHFGPLQASKRIGTDALIFLTA